MVFCGLKRRKGKGANMTRIGKMYISNDVVKEDIFPDVLAFIQFVPLRVEYLAHRNQFEYIGMSPMFDKIPPFAEPSIYSLEVTTTKDGKFKKAKIIKEL